MARAFWSAFLIPPPQCAPKSTARKLALSRGFSVRPHRCKARSGEACARLLVWGWPRLWVDLGERLRSRAYSRLAWPMGDGEVTFQLDRMADCADLARRLVDGGKAYEDEGAIRFRMPDEGVTAWDDAVRGRVEFPNEKLEDLVLVRSDGRPTYNFASPMEDLWDGITHVIRGEDHISNTPKQINIIRAVGGEPPAYAHVSHVLGADGKSLSKRHGSVTVDEFRREGYYAPALMNFLALLGWSYDDKTTIMSREELIARFTLDRVVPSPATFDYEKLDWMNGVYLRALSPG